MDAKPVRLQDLKEGLAFKIVARKEASRIVSWVEVTAMYNAGAAVQNPSSRDYEERLVPPESKPVVCTRLELGCGSEVRKATRLFNQLSDKCVPVSVLSRMAEAKVSS